MAEKLPPQPSPGYVGMLVMICAVMLVGIVVMAMEASEYDWDPKPKATTTIALPKVAGGASLDVPPAAVAEAKPVDDKKPTPVAEAKPEPAKPAVAVMPDAPAKPAEAPPTATVKVESKPPVTGPTPSPLNLGRPKSAPASDPAKPAEEPKPEQPKGNGPTPSPLRIGR